MSNSQAPREISVLELGGLALQRLTPGASGRVLACFSQALYLLLGPQELIWLGGPEMPMHRRSICVNAPLPCLEAGLPFQVRGSTLLLDDMLLETAGALMWQAPLPDLSAATPLAGLASRLQELIALLDLPHARGFGTFIPDLLRLAGISSPPGAAPRVDDLLGMIRPRFIGAVSACFQDQGHDILALAGALLGLGPGLTPSGDDFLGGLLFCLHGLNSIYGDMQFPYQPPPLAHLASRTHLISFSLLRDLAAGHTIAPLHELLNGLTGGSSLDCIAPSLSQLQRVGHSTGWDLLTGLLAGLLLSIPSWAGTPALTAPVSEV